MMKTKYWIGITTVVVAATAWGLVDAKKTFRTTARIYAVVQGSDSISGKPQYDFGTLAGHDLVNLALGTSLDTVRTNEVLSMVVNCGSTEASLVVYDKTADSNIAVIATSESFDVVTQQDDPSAEAPNRERFVAALNFVPGGNATNGLVAGTLMVSGRLHLDPATGCPRAVPVKLDKDKLDKTLCDSDFKDPDDTDQIVLRAGHGHAIGQMTVVSGGETNQVLIPHMVLSVRRDLPTGD